MPNVQNETHLKKHDHVTLPATPTVIPLEHGTLTIVPEGGPMVSATYSYSDGLNKGVNNIRLHRVDISKKGAIRIGTADDNDIVLPTEGLAADVAEKIERMGPHYGSIAAMVMPDNKAILRYQNVSDVPLHNPVLGVDVSHPETPSDMPRAVREEDTTKKFIGGKVQNKTNDVVLPHQPVTFQFESPERVEGLLTITPMEGTKVKVQVNYENGLVNKPPIIKDLATGDLTIGRSDSSDVKLSCSVVSRKHAKLTLGKDEGLINPIHYVDVGSSNGVVNPLFGRNASVTRSIKSAPAKPAVAAYAPGGEQVPEAANGYITARSGIGGGYTHENASEANPRKGNEDRAIAHSGPALGNEGAKAFLHSMIVDDMVPATQNKWGGSTISTAMMTKEGKVACSYLGDSPIYVIAQNHKTQDVKLIRMRWPHSPCGEFIENAQQVKLRGAPNNNDHEALRAYALRVYPQHRDYIMAAKNNPIMSGLARHLGRSEPHEGKKVYQPEDFLITPRDECPKGYEPIGIMVASDGIEKGVEAGVAQKAIQQLLAHEPNSLPREIAKVAVEASRVLYHDNTTAMVLNLKIAKAGDLVAVADGYGGSAEVAHTAIEKIHERCSNREVIRDAQREDSGISRSKTGSGS